MAKMTKTTAKSLKTGKLVVTAIKKLTKNTGWTTRTIVKFIKTEYRIADPAIGRKVSRALKRGVKLGVIQSERGRFRLTNMSGLAETMRASVMRLHRGAPRNRRQRSRPRPREGPLVIRSRSQSPTQ